MAQDRSKATRVRARASGCVELPEAVSHSFDGPYRTGIRVQFYGRFRSCISLDNVCTELGRQLIEAVPGAALHGYTGTPFFERDLERHAFVDARAPVAIFYGLPGDVPPSFFEHETTLGGFVCETDAIPPSWVDVCNRLELVAVPSRFCERAFRRSGVTTPILVVPHGLEPAYRPKGAKTRGEEFIFYHTGNTNMSKRKGCAELVRAFQRAFPGRTDVRLRLRVHRSFRLRRALADAGVRPDDPRIELEPPRPLPTAEFASLYSDVHCCVHPSKGEGFGLIPLQSIACETPVIAPSDTGMADYIDDTNAMVLRTFGRCDEPEVYYGHGSYPRVDEDHLVELLRHAEANWEEEYDKVRRAAPGIRERFRWPNVLAAFLELVAILAALPDPSERQRILRQASA